MKAKKFFKKAVCILMAAVMLAFSPMSEFVSIDKMETVEASSAAIGGAALLGVLLAGLGITMASGSESALATQFSSWLNINGQSESLETWNNGLLMSTVTVPMSLIQDVTTWAAEKFVDLKAGNVSSVETDDISFSNYDFSSSYSEAAFNYAYEDHGQYYYNNISSYAILSISSTSSYKGRAVCVCAELSDSPRLCLIVVPQSSGYYTYPYYLYDSGQMVQNTGGVVYGVTESLVRSCSNGGFSYYSFDFRDGSYYLENACYIVLSKNISLNRTVMLDDVLLFASEYVGFDNLKGIMTSYGDYSNDNLVNLAGLTLTASLISSIMSQVNNAVFANTSVAEDGTTVYSEAIAQAVSDAYALGISDAITAQPDIAEDAEKEAYYSDVTGWLSAIGDKVAELPASIYGYFTGTLSSLTDALGDVFDVNVQVKDLITTIPATIVDAMSEVFPKAAEVRELITSIPQTIVDAMTEVFPKAEDVRELITTLPKSIVDALSGSIVDTGIKELADSIAAVKEAVLAIPAVVTDAIVNALEGLFVPDLTLVESELDEFSGKFGWVEDLNSLFDDFLFQLEAGEPPVIYLDFTKAEDSKYHGAGLCLAIDFAWYEKYKPTGDLIVGAFLWVMYLWYLWKRVPDIISGAGFVVRDSVKFDGRMNRKESSTSDN